MLSKLARAAARRTFNWLFTELRDSSNDTTLTPWLQAMHRKLMEDDLAAHRPHYAWGVLNAASLAKHLQLPRISVIEFGVAGGNGLVALERIAAICEKLVGVEIRTYGFDSAVGLPKPVDYRDVPNLFSANDFPMNVDALRARLDKAKLIIGPIQDTIEDFVRGGPEPVGFVAIDVDFYSSTAQALRIFTSTHGSLLPRVYCYFDDIIGCTYSEFTGERLAIREFNCASELRKISPIYGLRYFVAREMMNDPWVEQMYIAHFFDHELYNARDGFVRTDRMDLSV
jgi:hypothetical protein